MSSYWKAFIEPLDRTVHRVISFVPRFGVALILFLFFLGLAHLIRRLLGRIIRRHEQIPWVVRVLIVRSAYLAFLFLGILVAMSAAEVNVTAVLTSLGVAGFALGFALKDILENFISGVLLLFARPFEVGDQVTLGNFEGTVIEIQLRTTTLQTYTGEMVAIPNSNVYTNPVTNKTRLGKRSYSVEFATSLKADVELVRREALAAVGKVEGILPDPPPKILNSQIDSQNDSLTWRIVFWAAPARATEVGTRAEVLSRIEEVIFRAGIPPPDTTQIAILKAPEPDPVSNNPALSPDRSAPP